MERISVLTLILFAIAALVQSTNNFASYTKTEIHIGVCADQPMETKQFRSKLHCARSCTKDPDCRRFLFRSTSSECKIYTDGTDCVLADDPRDSVCVKKNIGYVNNKLTCPFGFYGNSCQQVVTDCRHAFSLNMTTRNKELSARVFVKPNPTSAPFQVYCHLNYGGGTIIMERTFYCDHLMFNRTIDEYAYPFGLGKASTWIGFNNFISLQSLRPFKYFQMLLFTPNWKACSAYHFNFRIMNKVSNYTVKSSNVSPDERCNNSLLAKASLSGTSFSTKDNDLTGRNCAATFGGGLWFSNSIDCSKIIMANTMGGLFDKNSWLDVQGYERLIRMSLLVY